MYCLIALSVLTAQLSRVPLVGNQLVNDRLTPMAEEGMGGVGRKKTLYTST